jgi:hypothetical protein
MAANSTEKSRKFWIPLCLSNRSRYRSRILAIVALPVFAWLSACTLANTPPPLRPQVSDTQLLPGNKRVLSTFCPTMTGEQQKVLRIRPCYLATWNLDGSDIRVYRRPAGESWKYPALSPDGREAVFVLNDTGRFSTKLAILELATGEVRIVESSDTYKLAPSFHPNGRKVIYVTANCTPDNMETKTHVRVACVDVFGLDLTNHAVDQLTDFNFAGALGPHYTGKGDEFVVTAGMPLKNSDQLKRFENKYRSNGALRFDPKNPDLNPYFLSRADSYDAIPLQNSDGFYFWSGNNEKFEDKGSVFYFDNFKISQVVDINSLIIKNEFKDYYQSQSLKLSSDERYIVLLSGDRIRINEDIGQYLIVYNIRARKYESYHVPIEKLSMAAPS